MPIYRLSSDIFGPYQKKAGLESVLGVHETRHSFAVNYEELCGLMGHENPKTTLVYAAFSPKFLENARSVVNIGLKAEDEFCAKNVRILKGNFKRG